MYPLSIKNDIINLLDIVVKKEGVYDDARTLSGC